MTTSGFDKNRTIIQSRIGDCYEPPELRFYATAFRVSAENVLSLCATKVYANTDIVIGSLFAGA